MEILLKEMKIMCPAVRCQFFYCHLNLNLENVIVLFVVLRNLAKPRLNSLSSMQAFIFTGLFRSKRTLTKTSLAAIDAIQYLFFALALFTYSKRQ